MSRRFKIAEKDVAKERLVPDVSQMIERYVNQDIDKIYDLVEKIYAAIVPKLINENLVNKKFIIDNLVGIYIDQFGTNFAEFLEKHYNMIKEIGSKFILEYPIGDKFIDYIIPNNSFVDYNQNMNLGYRIRGIVAKFWENMAREEKFLSSNEWLNNLFEDLSENS